MPDPGPIPGAAEPSARSIVAGALLVALVSTVGFGYRLAAEPHFVDESAMVSQSYFADLLIDGKRDDPAWLQFPGYDSSPLPKYMIGATLRLAGHRRPGPEAAQRWFLDTETRFIPHDALVMVRRPFVVGAALGCVAIYALGVQLRDLRVGFLAALLLMLNPLYRMHARRAMADVLVEAFTLACLALLLWAWRRLLSGRNGVAAWAASAFSGIFAGLAALAKLNGLLSLVIVGAWALLTLALRGFPIGRRVAFLAAAIVAGGVAAATFVALNPFLTAHPPESRLASPLAAIARLDFRSRARMLIEHRREAAVGQLRIFPHNALTDPREKIAVAAVQGFGRFGPFGPPHSDSTRRYDRSQDWGAAIWLPWVAAGLAWALALGRRQWASRVPPTAWAVAVAAAVSAAVVTAYLPLAWDRYLLPLQPGSALLAAGVAVASADRMASAIGLRVPRPLRGRDT